MNILFSILSGIVLALAFPKFNLYWLAWVALVPFFFALLKSKTWKESLLCGFSFGVIFFGAHFFWMTTLFQFVKWWIVLGWIALVLFQTLFVFIFVLFLGYINPKKVSCALAAALLWTGIEWLRAQGPFGFTGGDLGYSQVQFLSLIQIASFASVYGVSFLIAFFNAAAAQFLLAKRRWPMLLFSSALVMIAMFYGIYVLNNSPLSSSQIPVPNSQFLKLSLIQPSIPQKDKMDRAKILPVFRVHEEMTRRAVNEKPDVIIWPETAIFSYLLHDSLLFPRVRQLAIDSKAWLVFGTPHYVGDKAYNSIVSMSPKGEIVSRYDKEQLVPFGEYLPFRKLLFPIFGRIGYYDAEFSSNPKPKLINAGRAKIAAAVCFESTFPGLIKKRAKKSADFILLVTNDAWFGDSSALYFHLNCGIFRAIENRKYFVQVGNTGITAVIDPYGRIIKQTKTNQRQILTFKIPLS